MIQIFSIKQPQRIKTIERDAMLCKLDISLPRVAITPEWGPLRRQQSVAYPKDTTTLSRNQNKVSFGCSDHT
jgi:hypothetical protein